MDLQATNNVLCHALLHILACFGRNQTIRAGLARARPADCLECIGWAFFAHSLPALLPRALKPKWDWFAREYAIDIADPFTVFAR
jgi:hypothetical protein